MCTTFNFCTVNGVCVKVICDVAIRKSERQIVSLVIILYCQGTYVHLSIPHVNLCH